MRLILFLALSASFVLNASAQATIGSDETPVAGALLQLKQQQNDGINSTKGMNLPRVELKTRTGDLGESLGAVSGIYDPNVHVGLTVYNTTTNETSLEARVCPGIHVWTGSEWVPLREYPPMVREEYDPVTQAASFVYLDPTNASDPNWEILGVDPSKYPLGPDKGLTDINGYEYNTTRFYVGFLQRKATYKVRESYSCDSDTPNWVQKDDEDHNLLIFEDGIWMNQNLRAWKYDPVRDNPDEKIAVSLTQTEVGVAITDPTLAKWTYPAYEATNDVKGFLYTWAAATNGDVSSNYTLGEINENGRRQGICPNGWHLPSDRQWTDLENALILNSTLFTDPSTDIDPTHTLITYAADYARGKHGAVIRSKDSGTGADQGISKDGLSGGFDAHDTGYIANGEATLFGEGAGWWTSSHPATAGNAERRAVFNAPATWWTSSTVSRDDVERTLMMSVRCMKNTDLIIDYK